MPNQTFQTQPYKGTRDFYPDTNQFVNAQKDANFLLYRQYIFDIWRTTLLNLGFVGYDCSVIEQAEIYLAKSGEELGGKQLYNFHDKSDRHIALRPEMTPSLARMVADKYSQLRFPLRWFSIPNCFRYEAPQKGRLREHWQVNADILGLEAGACDVELFLTLPELFAAFGAKKDQFCIYYNHRKIMDWFLQKHLQIEQNLEEIIKVIDDWRKFKRVDNEQFLSKFLEIDKIQQIADLCEDQNSKSFKIYLAEAEKYEEIKVLNELVATLYPDFEIKFNPAIIRGQAYYTGLVFEAFDGNKENPRSLVGGGRYDNLMTLFDKPKIPAIGFGSGDVTMFEFLQNWNLLDGHEKFEAWKKANVKEKVGIIPILNSENLKNENSFSLKKKEGDKVNFRQATLSDIFGILAVQKKSLIDTFVGEKYGITLEMVDKNFVGKEERLAKYFETGSYFVAEINSQIIGVSAAPADRIIRTVWVNPEYQRQGIGKNLMLMAIQELGDSGDINLETGLQKNGQAVKFYESLGFEKTGKIGQIKFFPEQTEYIECIEMVLKKERISKILSQVISQSNSKKQLTEAEIQKLEEILRKLS